MRIGISTVPTDYSVDIALLARWAEEMGFESLWVPEHTVIPVETSTPWPGSPDGVIPKEYADIADPFVALGRASAVTSTLKLGTGICLVPERNPLLLAKEVASLDMYTSGRFLFGIGAGWLKEETEIMGGDFPHRWAQTRDAIMAMKSLWTNVESEYHGRYYDFPPVYSFPRSVQRPHPPIYLGGMARNVFKRVVEWGDGWMPVGVAPEDISEGRQKLDELAADAGRDPSSISVSVFGLPGDRALISEFFDAGADRVMVSFASGDADRHAAFRELSRIAEEVLP